MVRKINESNKNDYCKYVVDEMFSVYSNMDPQYDNLDMAIDIVDKYITDAEYNYIDEQGYTDKAFLTVLIKKPKSVISKIENELANARFGFVKYVDRDAYNKWELSMLE